MSDQPKVQKYNSDMVDLLRPWFVDRNEPNYAWRAACSAVLALPALRAFWPMSSVDYATASRARDVAGGAYHLADNNTVTFGYDQLAPYAQFVAASSQFLSRADGGAANWADIIGTETYVIAAQRGLTIGGWFYIDSVSVANKNSLMTKGTLAAATSSYMLYLQQNTTEPRFLLSDGAAQNVHSTGASIGTTAWTFIVGKYDPSGPTSYVYINDTLYTDAAGVPAALNDSTTDFNIGARNNVADFLDGRASLCFLCAAALSNSIVGALFQNTRKLYGV